MGSTRIKSGNDAASSLAIFLFGRFTVLCRGRLLDGLHVPKTRDLLSYLLLQPQAHPREKLAELLWQDCDGARSRKYLRQALWQIQTCLGSQDDGRNYLLVDNDWVQINPKATFWLDVNVFENSFDKVQGIAGCNLSECDVRSLENAVELYRGDLLEGCYHDWCLAERERFQSSYLVILDKLMAYSEVQRQFDSCFSQGAKILACDRAHERTHRRLMRAYYMAGDRTMALRQYERCAAALAEELGVTPDRRTLMLYEQIKTGSGFEEPCTALEETSSTPLPEVLIQLEQLHTLLEDVQKDVRKNIRTVKQVLTRH